MSDPTGSGSGGYKRKKRNAMLKSLNAKVNDINTQLDAARQVYNDKDPRVKNLVSDSVAAVQERHDSVMAVTRDRAKAKGSNGGY